MLITRTLLFYIEFSIQFLVIILIKVYTMGKEMVANSIGIKKQGLKKSENWKLQEELFNEQLNAEPWSPSKSDFDSLIDEQCVVEHELHREKMKNEELKKEVLQFKKQIRMLKKTTMKLEEDLRNERKYNESITLKDETIAALENHSLLLKAELEILKKGQPSKSLTNGNQPMSLPLTSPGTKLPPKSPPKCEINNNDSPPPPQPHPKVKRRVSAISQLIQGFEQAAIAEAKALESSRRKTIQPFYRASL